MKKYHAGWDHFSPAPNTTDVMHCKVCEARMEVKRGIDGPTSSIEAMGQHKHLHDSFSCKYSGEDWHLQVLALKMRLEKEISKKIADLLTEEINEILTTKKVTIDKEWEYHWS